MAQASSGGQRREVVLGAALEVFVRQGYRNTSMDDVARAAHISRPGLYFLFESKQQLFAAAITRALELDLAAAAGALEDAARPLGERLLEAFDTWSGRYLGAAGGEIIAFAQAHRDVLGTIPAQASHRFHALVTAAVLSARPTQERERSQAIARTLIAAAIGLKHQTASPQTFHDDLATAIDLLLR